MKFQIFAILELSKFWKQMASEILKANRLPNFGSFLKAKWLATFWKLIASDVLLWLAAVLLVTGQKKIFCRHNTYVPVLNYCKTNTIVNARGSKMLATDHPNRLGCRRSGGCKKKSCHYWHGTLKFTNCEANFKASDSQQCSPEHWSKWYTDTFEIYKI